VVLNISKLTHS